MHILRKRNLLVTLVVEVLVLVVLVVVTLVVLVVLVLDVLVVLVLVVLVVLVVAAKNSMTRFCLASARYVSAIFTSVRGRC